MWEMVDKLQDEHGVGLVEIIEMFINFAEYYRMEDKCVAYLKDQCEILEDEG